MTRFVNPSDVHAPLGFHSHGVGMDAIVKLTSFVTLLEVEVVAVKAVRTARGQDAG